MTNKSIHQHYQTCRDLQCPLFDVNELNCTRLNKGDCRYQNIHVIKDANDSHQYLDGKKHGKYRYWHRSGKLWHECSYKNGEYHGIYKEWYYNGQLEEESTYVNGNISK